MRKEMVLALFILPGFSGCAQTPAEIVYTTAMLAKYHQCTELPLPAHEQCIDTLKEREAEGRRDAEKEYARRQQRPESSDETSGIARAMKENDRKY